MSETKAVKGSISIILPVAASFCIYQLHTQENVGHHCGIRSQDPCEIEYEKLCLNSGECYYLADNYIVAVIAHGYIEENDVKGTCSGTRLEV